MCTIVLLSSMTNEIRVHSLGFLVCLFVCFLLKYLTSTVRKSKKCHTSPDSLYDQCLWKTVYELFLLSLYI